MKSKLTIKTLVGLPKLTMDQTKRYFDNYKLPGAQIVVLNNLNILEGVPENVYIHKILKVNISKDNRLFFTDKGWIKLTKKVVLVVFKKGKASYAIFK